MQTHQLVKGSKFWTFKVCGQEVEVSEWNGYDIKRTTRMNAQQARVRWQALRKDGFVDTNTTKIIHDSRA
jgi:hypothetical protein